MYLLFFCAALCTSYSYCSGVSDTLFKVKRIKTKGDYYIIHAQRNDSLFKIISKKVQIDKNPDLEMIVKGKYYYFDFVNPIKESTKDKVEPLSGVANHLDVKNKNMFVDGNTRIRFTKRFHYRLYTTNNLVGLYYIPPPPVD